MQQKYTKIKSLHSTTCILSDSKSLLSKFVPYGDHNFNGKCGIKHKIIKKTNPVNTLRPRDSFCFLLVSSHFFYSNFKRPIPSQNTLNNKYKHHSTSQSTARKSPANGRTPSITSSEPLPKRPENPSRATAVFSLGRVYLGPRRDQLLDHGGVAVPSRVMQRRLASGAGDATRTAGLLRLPWRNKA